VQSYYADFWSIFGLTPLTIWDLPAREFFGMTIQVDKIRREAERDRNRTP
jgi:hypothetical protein